MATIKKIELVEVKAIQGSENYSITFKVGLQVKTILDPLTSTSVTELLREYETTNKGKAKIYATSVIDSYKRDKTNISLDWYGKRLVEFEALDTYCTIARDFVRGIVGLPHIIN